MTLADSTAAAFHRRFYDPENATYGDFGSNVFALEMGVPEERRAAVVETLRAELQDTYHNHLNTGMLATRYLFEVLARNGLNDLACDLLLRTTIRCSAAALPGCTNASRAWTSTRQNPASGISSSARTWPRR